MNQKQRIVIAAFCEGKNKKQIARETSLNIKTVRRYIDKYEMDLQRINAVNTKSEIQLIADSIVEPPKYNARGREKRKLTKDIIERVEEHLKENEVKRKNGMHKQQKRKIDIYESLKEEGVDISYTTITTAINKILGTGNEAFIRAEYGLGEICEFDWGEIKLNISGKLKTFQMAVFTSAKGNYRYATLFPKQDTSCFIESHAIFFEHLGGAYRIMVYDNMKVAVRKFVGPTEKEPTEALLKLSIYYGFNFRFCNVRAGNEKPHVERSVDHIRHKVFSHRIEFTSIDEANQYLKEECQKINFKPQKCKDNKSAIEILNEERPYLLKAMPMYDAAKTVEARVDKYSTITIGTCHYSVPEELVGQMIFIKIYSNQIICFKDGVKVAEHKRLHGFNEWTLNLNHFLKTLKRKPGALASSTAMNQAEPQIQYIYKTHFIKKEKEFIDLLQIISQTGIEPVLKAIESLEKLSPLDISVNKINLLCLRDESKSLMPTNKYTSHPDDINEITENSIEMLKLFKKLVPEAPENFMRKVPII